MKMEGRKIALCITHSGAYMDTSDDPRLRLPSEPHPPILDG